MKAKIALAVLTALALGGCVNITPPISTGAPYACGITAGWGSWAGYASIGVLLSIFIITLVYMAGSVLGLANISVWAKNELFQALGSLIIVANLIFIVGILCSPALPPLFGLDPGIIGLSGQPNLYDYAFAYTEWLNRQIIEGWLHAFIIQWRVAIATSYTYGAQPGGIGITLQPMAGLSALESALNLILQSFTIAWITNMVQIEILKFILVSMFNIVLPMGVVLRCFSFTRAFGGALMGIAVGLFIFYPILLGINMLGIAEATNSVVNSLSSPYTCTAGSYECCSVDPCRADGKCPKCIFAGEADPNIPCCSGQTDSNNMCVELKYEGDVCGSNNECFSGRCDSGRCASCKLAEEGISVSGEEALGMLRTIGRVAITGIVTYLAPILPTFNLPIGGPLLVLIGGFHVLFNLIDLISNILIGAILLPAFNFILLITITRDLSRFFGEEVDVSNLTRMI